MEAYICCQSCGMPMDRLELMGTEKDGSKSTIYCKFCYQNGEFTDPDITLEAMKRHVGEELKKTHAPDFAIIRKNTKRTIVSPSGVACRRSRPAEILCLMPTTALRTSR